VGFLSLDRRKRRTGHGELPAKRNETNKQMKNDVHYSKILFYIVPFFLCPYYIIELCGSTGEREIHLLIVTETRLTRIYPVYLLRLGTVTMTSHRWEVRSSLITDLFCFQVQWDVVKNFRCLIIIQDIAMR
jgi:hypothetical protein